MYLVLATGVDISITIPEPDRSNKVIADIDSSGKIFHFEESLPNSTNFNRFIQGPASQNSISVSGYNENISIELNFVNIINPGIYKFGKNINLNQEIKASCKIGSIYFLNDHNVLSGTLIIDSLTSQRIKGSFKVKCRNGADSVNINNGSFVGKFY